MMRALLDDVRDIRMQALARERAMGETIDALSPAWKRSAANLEHYRALRATDHVALQGNLVRNGLSSLSRREAHVQMQIGEQQQGRCHPEGKARREHGGETSGLGRMPKLSTADLKQKLLRSFGSERLMQDFLDGEFILPECGEVLFKLARFRCFILTGRHSRTAATR